jgi:hypothetical protein
MFDTPFTNINDQGVLGEYIRKKIVETIQQIIILRPMEKVAQKQDWAWKATRHS